MHVKAEPFPADVSSWETHSAELLQSLLTSRALAEGPSNTAASVHTFSFSTSNEGNRNYLKKDNNLLLTFTFKTLSEDQFAMAWKVLTISSESSVDIPVTYTGKWGVGVPVMEDGRFISGGVDLPLKLGERAELHKTERAYHWTMVPSKPNDKVSVTTAVNKTKQIINMYAGTYSTKKPPTFEPVMLYKNISEDEPISFGLPLRLQVYANRNLVDLDVARRDLGILLGEWDILKLSESGTEHFTVYEDGDAGRKLTLVSDRDDVRGFRTA